MGASFVMGSEKLAMDLLERRRIEAEFVKGLFESLSSTIGREQALAALTKAIEDMALKAGAAFAQDVAKDHTALDLEGFAKVLPCWQANDALDVTLHETTAQALDFDVTRCAFADMYRELGIAELGPILSCHRDGNFSKGFNPQIEMSRTQTIMQGASHCDFRFRLNEKD